MKKLQYHHRLRQYRQLQLETEHAKLERFLAKLHALDQLESTLSRQSSPGDQDLRHPHAMMLAMRRAELQHQIAVQRMELTEARRRYELLSSVWSGRGKSTSHAAGGRGRESLVGSSLALG